MLHIIQSSQDMWKQLIGLLKIKLFELVVR